MGEAVVDEATKKEEAMRIGAAIVQMMEDERIGELTAKTDYGEWELRRSSSNRWTQTLTWLTVINVGLFLLRLVLL